MPARDGTGPMGMGPMTGWGRGWCGRGRGRGFGFGRGGGYGGFAGHGRFGMGRGWGGVWAEPYSPEAERAYLQQEMEMLKARMEELQARLGREEE
ncbi:MAG: DUF5320 domain-containing protein [Aminivibrio sp.]|jgi:hypothetical protein